MESVIRVLPYAVADGPTNMAADEALVHSAAAGVASLRSYGWTEATLSLGYFQPSAIRLSDPRLANLPWVRRPSGGATLVHHHELTYCLALPAGAPWQTGQAWMPRMHRIITLALAELGLAGQIEPARDGPIQHGDVLCFQQHTPGDLLIGHSKMVGSSQRKYRQALMQHGSILIAQSEHTPLLPGIREVTGVTLLPLQIHNATIKAFAAETGWPLCSDDWTEEENASIEELVSAKYSAAAWNEKR